MPCLIIGNVILPGSAFRLTTFMGNAPQQDFQVDHLLLVAEIGERFQRKQAAHAARPARCTWRQPKLQNF